MPLSQLEVLACQIYLFQVLIAERHQQLRSCSGMNSFRPAQRIERIGVIRRSHVEIAEQECVVAAPWVRRDHLFKEAFSVFGVPHQAVGLRKSDRKSTRRNSSHLGTSY